MAEHGIDTLDIIQVKRCADRFSRLDFYDDVPNTSRVYLEARKMSLSELEAKDFPNKPREWRDKRRDSKKYAKGEGCRFGVGRIPESFQETIRVLV